MAQLYRVVPEQEWIIAESEGVYRGSAHDLGDGFIHLSAAHQVKGTLAAHYAGRTDLVLLTIDGDALLSSKDGKLLWEPSRDGEQFPHFYGVLPMNSVQASVRLVLDANGEHMVPPTH
jgi:uncharacterized protein (DUF952 family)